MKKLFIYLKDYKKQTLLGPLFKLLEALFELIVPLIVKGIIDVGISGGDKNYIIKMCIVLIILALVGLASSVSAQYFAAKAAIGFVTKIRHFLFRHIESLSYSELDEIGTSTLITRITSDINQVQSGVNMTLRLLLRSPFIVFGAMLMAFSVDFKSALIFAAAIPVLSAVVFVVMFICIPLYKKVQARLDAVLLKTRENLTGARVIRAFCKEDEEISEFETENETLTQLQLHVGRISAFMNPATYVIINFAVIALVYVGAIRVNSGLITTGAVVALYNYMSQILVELIKLANLIINITKSIACGNRIQTIFDIKPSITGAKSVSEISEKSEYAVEFKNVSLRYKNAAENCLSGISFKIKKGETVGIIGSTGSGKTSLVNLIPRFYEAQSGEVDVFGTNVKDYPPEVLRQKIGVVPQKAVLFKGTIRDNLTLGNKNADDKTLETAVLTAQAGDVINKKENGLLSEVEQGGKNFSGGQRQRLTIARALAKNAEIIILDDSSSALDFATDAALRNALRENMANVTAFIVSQRASSVMHADRIIVLDKGEIAGMGTHGELLDVCEVYKEIYSSQFKSEAENNVG